MDPGPDRRGLDPLSGLPLGHPLRDRYPPTMERPLTSQQTSFTPSAPPCNAPAPAYGPLFGPFGHGVDPIVDPFAGGTTSQPFYRANPTIPNVPEEDQAFHTPTGRLPSGGPYLRGSLDRGPMMGGGDNNNGGNGDGSGPAQAGGTGVPNLPPSLTIYERDQIRITINSLPDNYEEYPMWRFSLAAAVLNAGIEVSVCMKFLDEMDTLPFERLMLPQSHELSKLDARLFTSVVNAIKGRHHLNHMKQFMSLAQFGCGRQAIRLLDISHRYENRKQASKASSSLVDTKCANMKTLTEYMVAMRYNCFHLQNIGIPATPTVAIDLVKKTLAPITDAKLRVALAEFERDP